MNQDTNNNEIQNNIPGIETGVSNQNNNLPENNPPQLENPSPISNIEQLTPAVETPSQIPNIPQTPPLVNNNFVDSLEPNSVPNKASFSKSIVLVVIGVIIGVALIGGSIYAFTRKGVSSSTKTNNKSGKKLDVNKDIKDISISASSIMALANDGELYFIGDNDIKILGVDEIEYNDVAKIATDVIAFKNSYATYYIDKNHDLYYTGSSYNGGSTSEIVKETSNVKSIAVYSNFCGFIINDNNELYAKNNQWGYSYCGLDQIFEEYQKIADNVKTVFAAGDYSGYINENDELFLSFGETNYEKILDNVKAISKWGWKTVLILTNDNKLYYYHLPGEEDPAELSLIRDDIAEMDQYTFKTTDDKHYLINDEEKLAFINGESSILVEGPSGFQRSDTLYYGASAQNDIKKVLYYDITDTLEIKENNKSDEVRKLIYLANNGKIVMIDQEGKKEVPNNIQSLGEIFDFILKKHLVSNN